MRPVALIGLSVLSMAGSTVAVPALAHADILPRVLYSLDHGRWDLRPIGSGKKVATRSICLRPTMKAISIVHGGQGKCDFYATEDKVGEASLSYSCSGGDQGMTRVRSESPRLMVMDTQGIAGGQPFHMKYEGRFVGKC